MARHTAAALAALAVVTWAEESACDANAAPDCEHWRQAANADAIADANVAPHLLQARAKPKKAGPHQGHVNMVHEFLGCFPRSPDDTDDAIVFEDTKCINVSESDMSSSPCRTGLPFFRLALQKEESFVDCFSFCVSKGMDLCGLSHSKLADLDECRCGATPLNTGIWAHSSPPSYLLLPNTSVPEDDEQCTEGAVLVWKYTGGLENGSMPTPLMELGLHDLQYIDGIANHTDPETIHEEDEPGVLNPYLPLPNMADENYTALLNENSTVWHPNEVWPLLASPDGNYTVRHPNATVTALLGVRGICEDLPKTGIGAGGMTPCSTAKAWCNDPNILGSMVRGACPLSCGACSQAYGWMSCYPHPCSPGGGPWLTKSGSTVYINYYFTSNIDSTRQAAFNKAKAEWESKVCIKFVWSNRKPVIKVTISNYNTCSSGVGYPGQNGETILNLGWCNQVSHWGSIAHELGHALGMNHEQNRADGPAQGYTPTGWKGPYLRVKWGNIQPLWWPQWKPEKRSYIGSKTVGYVPYDYSSVMHYGLGDNADIASGHSAALKDETGQRQGLSSGDVKQFNDMYQCGPAPVPAPAPSPGPAPSGCADASKPFGYSCAQWKQSGACRTSANIQKYCKRSCGTHECRSSSSGGSGGGRVCADATGKVSGYMCSQWAASGACDTSGTIRKECPASCTLCRGNCWDSLDKVSGAACHVWRKSYGATCGGSQTLKKSCPNSCGAC